MCRLLVWTLSVGSMRPSSISVSRHSWVLGASVGERHCLGKPNGSNLIASALRSWCGKKTVALIDNGVDGARFAFPRAGQVKASTMSVQGFQQGGWERLWLCSLSLLEGLHLMNKPIALVYSGGAGHQWVTRV
jgi:hypothetical protein